MPLPDVAPGEVVTHEIMRLDEVLAAWEFIDPLVDTFTKRIPLIYRSGSMGPADNLLTKDARYWVDLKEGL